MKLIRTVFLPLLLCSAILFTGYCSPMLFDRITPNLQNKVRTISISGTDSPIYLENAAEVVLPPWDKIIVYQAEPLVDTFTLTFDEQVTLGDYIAADIAALFPNMLLDSQFQFMDMTGSIQLHQEYPSYFLFLQDYSCSFSAENSAAKTKYQLDFVLDGRNMLPLYLHLRTAETAPVIDENSLRSDMEQLINKLKYDFWQELGDPVEILLPLSESDENTYKASLADAMLALLSHDDYSFSLWFSILLNCREIYTLPYENETLLVMTNDQNLTCCLFFDGVTNRVTGYSIDPSLVPFDTVSESTFQ